ncbi:methionine aminopeptidase 1D, mitochondrial isoform X2 [Petromyzon marinus]|uniref:Methionine aminopeptidase n=1 Tax=Petromyzon marinus TaxID=7757 RepID=A0AAJ7UCY5_PETMA|nr:methionine aminopeptidase 1D, mitochondrial isoform X2 [Petromyzon marinus]
MMALNASRAAVSALRGGRRPPLRLPPRTQLRSVFGGGLWRRRAYAVVEPALVGPAHDVPEHIERPDYVLSGAVPEWGDYIELKGPEELAGVRAACQLARHILLHAASRIQVGTTTEEIDGVAHREAVAHGAYPSPLGYRGFPKSVCTSVNNVACHGIPDSRPLQNGDIVNVDVTVYHEGFHGDTSETVLVGDVDAAGRRLVEAARRCRDAAIAACGPGQPLCVIGNTISRLARDGGFSVCPYFVGHGIGSYFHGHPEVWHHENDVDLLMEEGMVFTIEPILMEGSPEVRTLADGWTVVTLDHSRSAQAEHTVAITSSGVETLTRAPHELE